MPDDLKSIGIGGIDMSSFFMIPQMDTFTHTMSYEPNHD